MAISDAVKRSPVYREIFGLMEAKKIKAINQWQKDQLKFAKKNYAPYVSAGMFSTYETELELYTRALESAHADYHSPGAGSVKKENILTKLISQDRKKLANAIRIMDERRRENAKTAPSVPSHTESPKKSSGWKRFLAWTGVIAALYGFFQWGKSQRNSSPQEGDKAPQGMEQRSTYDGVTQNGNTWSQNPTSELKSRLEQARLVRMIEQEEAAAEKAKLSKVNSRLQAQRGAAYTGKYVQEQGQETAQGAAYTGWYVREKKQESARSQNRTVRDAAYTGGYVQGQGEAAIRGRAETARQISGARKQIRRDTYTW